MRLYKESVRAARSNTLFALGLCAALAAGCGIEGTAPAQNGEDGQDAEHIGQATQALSSCNGAVVKTGSITDQFGSPLGSVYLYYSGITNSICGQAIFSGTHGSFQICATNNTDVSQPPKCVTYSAATPIGATPAQFLRVSDVGSTTVFVNSPTLGTGFAGFYTRTF
jgi:hypothetical protein